MDLNKIMLIGNVGRDPEFRKLNDNELAKFSLCTSRKWKDRSSGEQREEANWHNIVVFSPYLVDLVKRFVQKGTRLYIEGEVKTRSYEKDGETKWITEVVVPQIKGEIMLLGRAKEGDNSESTPPSSGRYPEVGSPNDFDDDIPF